jgi:hypothetical protein
MASIRHGRISQLIAVRPDAAAVDRRRFRATIDDGGAHRGAPVAVAVNQG